MSETNGQCDAQTCICQQGRRYNRDWSLYEIVRCRFCGSSGVHVICGNLVASNPVFECKVCQEIEDAIRVKDEALCQDFGVPKCFVKAVKIICKSRSVRVEKSEDTDSYEIVNADHGPTSTLKTPALTPSKDKWKIRVKSFGDVTPASNGLKKKRGRPRKSSSSLMPPNSPASVEPSVSSASFEPSVTSALFVPSIIGIKKKESPAMSSVPSEATVLKKRGRPRKNSHGTRKSVSPDVTIIAVQKKRGRPSKNSIVTPKSVVKDEKCTLEQFRQIREWAFVDLSRSIVELPDGTLTTKVVETSLPQKQGRTTNEKSFQTSLISNVVKDSSPGKAKQRGRPRKRKIDDEDGNSASKRIALDPTFEAVTSSVIFEAAAEASLNPKSRHSPAVGKQPLAIKPRGRPKSVSLSKKNSSQNVTIANGISPGSAKRRGRPPKNSYLVRGLKPGPASSKKPNQTRHRSPSCDIVDSSSSSFVPTVVNVHEETVFVDVRAVNDVAKKRRGHVDNNNKSKRKNKFYVREKILDSDDEDDGVIIL